MASIGQQLLDVPFGEMVTSLALSIAEAQYELDLVGVEIAQMMAGEEVVPDPDDPEKKIAVTVDFGDQKGLSLLELGFTPSFYQFVDTVIEVKVSINMTSSQEFKTASSTKSVSAGGVFFGFGGTAKATATSVSASYASKYSYSAEGSSLIRTKLVPVPPPTVLEERIRALLASREEE
ncbi:hypothetical protein [Granulosicoccus antarcticus]|uniref:Uncharacterized protein n=1 Tax=Granulosicoccus antarcticus IMCC3135 TaxID=1192854 RepID=A0A2Z2NLF2_9GAMM|nr:hypothetical protein [Granulosicoccus antarcticus]ASJ71979.1 hypothetical protein IMCC3135_09410 [Granulosicoccus antarcticus IMCC3135]